MWSSPRGGYSKDNLLVFLACQGLCWASWSARARGQSPPTSWSWTPKTWARLPGLKWRWTFPWLSTDSSKEHDRCLQHIGLGLFQLRKGAVSVYKHSNDLNSFNITFYSYGYVIEIEHFSFVDDSSKYLTRYFLDTPFGVISRGAVLRTLVQLKQHKFGAQGWGFCFYKIKPCSCGTVKDAWNGTV